MYVKMAVVVAMFQIPTCCHGEVDELLNGPESLAAVEADRKF